MENAPKLIVESKVDKFTYYIGYGIYIAFFIYFLTIFKQNPILISILLVVLLFFIVILNYVQIKVYSNKIEVINKRPFRFVTSIKVFYFDEISAVETTLKIYGTSGLLIQLIGIFRLSVNLVSSNYFTIIFKTTKKKTFNTQIEGEDLIKVFHLVEKLSGNKIRITGLDQKIPLL